VPREPVVLPERIRSPDYRREQIAPELYVPERY
jgi:hypothetical protein